MKTILDKLTRISLAVTVIVLVAFVFIGNIWLAVINYKIQQVDSSTLGGQVEIYKILYNGKIEQPEGLALAIHIMTITLILCAVIWFLSVRFATVKLPKPTELFK